MRTHVQIEYRGVASACKLIKRVRSTYFERNRHWQSVRLPGYQGAFVACAVSLGGNGAASAVWLCRPHTLSSCGSLKKEALLARGIHETCEECKRLEGKWHHH